MLTVFAIPILICMNSFAHCECVSEFVGANTYENKNWKNIKINLFLGLIKKIGQYLVYSVFGWWFILAMHTLYYIVHSLHTHSIRESNNKLSFSSFLLFLSFESIVYDIYLHLYSNLNDNENQIKCWKWPISHPNHKPR